MRRSHPTLIVPDVHVPYHDESAVQACLEVARSIRPKWVIFLGDFLDCYKVSRWSKNPERTETLQDEIEQGKELLARFRQAAPGAACIFIAGNHEDRIRRYLWDAPGLSSLKCLDVAELLGLEKMGFIRCYKYGERHRHFGTLLEHGNIARRRSGYTAHGMLDARQVSGVSGHTHRLAHVHRTSQAGHTYWIEAGCLCSLDPEYIQGAPDWQHGCAIGWVVNEKFQARTVRILDGAPLL